MGSCNSGEHIAGGHIHKEITCNNIEETQMEQRLETVSTRLLKGGEAGLKLV